MARQIIITLPDDEYHLADSDYIREVAAQLEGGYVSGHVDPEHHWTTERNV